MTDSYLTQHRSDFPKRTFNGEQDDEKDAQEGGDVAGSTRKEIEKKLGKSVVLRDNFLEKTEEEKRLSHKKKK